MSCNIWKYVRSDLYLTAFRDADYGTCKMSISYRSLHLPRLFFDVLDWMTKKQKHCLVKSFFGYSLVDFGQKALALVKFNSFLYEFFAPFVIPIYYLVWKLLYCLFLTFNDIQNIIPTSVLLWSFVQFAFRQSQWFQFKYFLQFNK